jgi:tetratricopeptide (TPR) repeat protein
MQSCKNNLARSGRSGKIHQTILSVPAWFLLGSCLVFASPAAGTDNLSQGRSALRTGKYAEAAQFFGSALDAGENPEQSESGLLEVLRITGRYQEAIKRISPFLSAHPDSASLHLEGGRIYRAVGDYTQAEASLRKSISLASIQSAIRMDAMRNLADLLEEVGRKGEAHGLWDGLIEEYRQGHVQGSRSLGTVAVAAWRKGFIYDAGDMFLDATDSKLGEVSLEALTDYGYLFLEKYNATEAMVSFKDCLKINGSYPDALIGMAQAKKYSNDFEVEAYAREALKINPNLVPARDLLAELALDAEYYDDALREIQTALEVNPVDLESLSLLAVCHFIRGDSDAFEATEKKVLAINPGYGRFYYVLATNLVSRRKYEEAVNFSRKAIALDPELWSAYVTLGMNLTRIGDLDGGRKAMEQAFEGDRFNAWAVNSLDLFDQMDTFVQSASDHFRYQMAQEDGPILSSYAARLAEEAYPKLTRRYGFQPQGPLFVEMFPDHAGFAVRTLGEKGMEGALGVCFGKVIAMDSPRARNAGTFNWGTTLWHEFTHVITLQMTHHNIPRWFSEGLSVLEEHRARPGWGDGIDLAFIKAYKAGKLLKASELNQGFTRPENPGQIALAYVQAYLVCAWMEEKYGFESIRQSLRLFAENKPAEEVFLQTLGLNTEAMDAEYARYIDSRVKAIASHINIETGDTAARRIDKENPDKSTLEQKLKDTPDDFFANLQLGTALQKEGAFEEAEVYLKKAEGFFPQYVEQGNPYQLLAQVYLKTQRENEALDQLNKWIRMDGNAREPLIKAAEIYHRRKDWASLARVLDLSVYIYPYDMRIQKELGETLLQLKDWDPAIAAYQTLVALDTTDPAEAHLDLAEAFFASGNMQAAKKETLRSLEIAPSYRKAQQLLLKLSGDRTE